MPQETMEQWKEPLPRPVPLSGLSLSDLTDASRFPSKTTSAASEFFLSFSFFYTPVGLEPKIHVPAFLSLPSHSFSAS